LALAAGEPGLRARVVLALLLMVAAKGTNVLVPLVYARAVDALSPQEGAAAIAAVPIALVLGYGLLRICSSGFAELRDAVFVKVQARAARRIALRVFQHLHALSLRFHLDRQTGGLSRVLERGTRGITFTLDFMLFTIVPTIIEILLVAAILWGMFDISFAAATLGTIGVYIAFTLVFTIGAAVPAGDERDRPGGQHQGHRQPAELRDGQVLQQRGARGAAVRRLARPLREGLQPLGNDAEPVERRPGLIIAVGPDLVMLLAARGVAAGRMTVGDFVLVNTYLIQLYMPLNNPRLPYREIKQGLTDMEEMFRSCASPREVEGTRRAPVPSAAGRAIWYSRTCASATGRPRRSSRGFPSGCRPGGRWPSIVGPTGAGQVHHLRAAVPLLRRDPAPSAWDGQDAATT
jgi:ATP-binding cassette subfamily B protein